MITKVLILLLSIYNSIFIQMNLNKDINFSDSIYSTNFLVDIMIFLISYTILKEISNDRNKRLIITTSLLSCLFSIALILGFSIKQYNDLSSVMGVDYVIVKSIFKFIAYFISCNIILYKLFIFILNYRVKGLNIKLSNRKIYIVTTLTITITWMPYILSNLPGVVWGDSFNQIYQFLGIEPLSTHHSIIHTLLMGKCIEIGKFLSGDYWLGILIYIVIALLIVISILSYSIIFMLNNKFDKYIVIGTMIFYCFYPSLPMLSISLAKDSIFSVFVLLFVICLYKICSNVEFGEKNSQLAFTFLSSMCMILFRKNGVYLVMFTIIGLLFTKQIKRVKSKIIVVLIFAIIINSLIEGPIALAFGIKQGSPREALSLPLQQFARVLRDEYENLTKEDDEKIRYYFKDNRNVGMDYYPLISDSVKNHFDEDAFSKDKIGLIKMSIKLLVKYPKTSIEAFLCNSYGYWYPDSINWFYAKSTSKDTNYLNLIENHSYGGQDEVVQYVYFDKIKHMPIINLVCSIGIVFWMIFVLVAVCIYKRKYISIIIFIPLIVLWLTSIASPVWNELRYTLGAFVTFPTLLAIVTKDNAH